MKKKLSTRILSVFLAMLMVVSILPTGMITATAAGWDGNWPSDYRYWGQYTSADRQMNYYGCWVTADAKMIYESGIKRNSFNPDVLKDWYRKNGYLDSGFYKQNSTYAPIAYARSVGNYNLSFLGTTTSKCAAKAISNAKAGYYSILRVRNNGHYVLVDNYDTVRTGKLWIYESASTKYSNFERSSCPKSNSYTINAVYTYSYSGKKEETKPPIPNAPNTPNLSASNVSKGNSVTITWNGVSGATGYNLAVRGAETKDINVGNATSYTYKLNNASSYNFCVSAYNSTGSSNWSGYNTCTAHNPVTVSFKDWDGSDLKSQTVDWGKSATAPQIPNRKGYTFAGWEGAYQNLTSNSTVKATYKINQYTVNFLDKSGKTIKTEKVDYNTDATPPTETNAPLGYTFVGWNSDDYKNVYTESTNKTINIQGIYEWGNEDLPIVTSITSARRQSDGYYVYFDLTNYPNAITRGRAVVSLKTESGKLVDMSESSAFSIAKDSTKNGMEVFIPSDKAATKVEVIVVDSYSSGVPISNAVTATIDQGLMWSAWSTEQPADSEDLETESKTQYRYRDKETSTGNTSTKSGWIYTGNRTESVGNWSGWSWNAVSGYTNESTKREVQTQTAVYSYNYATHYNYSRYKGNGRFGPCAGTWNGIYCGTYQERGWGGQLNCYGSQYSNQYGGTFYKYNNTNDPWYNERSEQYVASTNYGTQYRYRDTNYTYHFYRWKDWSDWSDNVVTATSNKEVETQTVYRYKSISAATEDDTGKVYTISNKLDGSFAGKQITLYVYGYTGASDYTNEYIGQSTVGEDGSYSFTFKLREEPTVKTGDFTVAIGIEGTTDLIVIDTIEAPKPKYIVNFYDWDGTIIDTQLVTKGENAVLPTNPSKEGYDFIGWDKTNTNITGDTDIFADFKKQEFTVVFVDWANQVLKTEKFNYGDVLVTPDFSDIEGYTCTGWDEVNAGNTVVTSNMVVSAKYEINTYNVSFYDFEGNVIETQEVEFGSSAEAPESLENGSDGQIFAGWFDPENYENVNQDVEVYPAYYFEETVDVPTVNYESGEYDSKISLTLTSNDENAVIFYYLNDDESTERIYSTPITVDKTCSVTYYATSFGKNDSEKETNYYCINSGDPSDWMPYNEIPDEVKQNVNEYLLENDTGYRYKNTVETSNGDEASNYEAEGWLIDSTRYSEWSDWQDEPIEIDSTKLGFEVTTQEVADTTVTNYQYSHYKYTDDNGDTQYSPVAVDGYDCQYETITLETKLTIAGFTDDNISYYTHDSQTWFKQTKVSGTKTQYRSHYQIVTYYMWTGWTVDVPSSNEKREYESDDVYRYTNKKYHIVEIFGYSNNSTVVDLIEDSTCINQGKYNDIAGYQLEGLYIDEKYTNKFDVSVPVTESLSLFVKYNPNPYTVVFQMQDGTELDTQSVLYGESAIAPDTDSVPGYVFAGWDKTFDCITEDTVVTGKYVKESEYAYISLSSSKLNMQRGNASILSYSITPANLTDEIVTWSTSDGGVASVDENGIVKAIAPGEAIITATVKSSKETASCKITVENDIDNFITLKTDSSLNHDDLGYLRRVTIQSSIEAVSKEFANGNLKFYNINGTELTSSDFVGTGTQIKLFNGDNVVDTETVVITGDMTGDGIINNRDVAMMNKKLVDKAEAEECQMLAIDVNGDGYVNNRDAAMVARYLVGKDTF